MLLLSVILLLLILNLYFRQKFRKESYWRARFKQVQQENIALFKELLPYLSDLNWWLTAGNLLGLVRHKNKFIPWDDDIDIAVLKDENWTKFKNNLPFPFSLTSKFYGFDISHPSYPSVKIDIFLMEERDGIINGTKEFKKMWPTEWLTTDELYPLKIDTFEEMSVYVPNKPTDFLQRAYGSSWKTPKLTKIHKGNPLEKLIIWANALTINSD